MCVLPKIRGFPYGIIISLESLFGHGGAGHSEGRRARYRQEYCGCGLGLQQLQVSECVCVSPNQAICVHVSNISSSFGRVVDLGVMTPCEKIIKTAINENAGMYMHTRAPVECHG